MQVFQQHIYRSNPRSSQSQPCLATPRPRHLPENFQTAGVEVFRSREISAWGIVLIAMLVFAMMAVWSVSRIADRRAKMAEKLEVKVVDWYIATGEVSHALDIIGNTIRA